MAKPGSRALTQERIEFFSPQVVEMEMDDRHLSQGEIAEAIGMSVPTLRKLKSSTHYQAILKRITSRQERAAEQASIESTHAIRKKLNLYSTEAIEVLVELMRNAKLETVRLSAACEIIDRDGRFAKVSRMMNVNQGQDGAPMLPEDVSAEILDALRATKGTVQ